MNIKGNRRKAKKLRFNKKRKKKKKENKDKKNWRIPFYWEIKI